MKTRYVNVYKDLESMDEELSAIVEVYGDMELIIGPNSSPIDHIPVSGINHPGNQIGIPVNP